MTTARPDGDLAARRRRLSRASRGGPGRRGGGTGGEDGGGGYAPAPGWLEWARARFYRRWGSNPWRVARFDAWYGWRRAELDRRWAGLDRRRSEPHHGWPGPEASWHRDRDD